MTKSLREQLVQDLESPPAVRGFGSGWFSGFFGIVLAIIGLCFVAALRWQMSFAMPELAALHQWAGFRLLVHLTLLGAYGLALLSLSCVRARRWA